jgi:hypothetical protein
MRDWAAELVEPARREGVELTGDNGLLTALVRQVLQTGLEVEMTDHLGYEPTPPKGVGQLSTLTPVPGIRLPSASMRPLRRAHGGVLSPPQGSRTPRGAPGRQPTGRRDDRR